MDSVPKTTTVATATPTSRSRAWATGAVASTAAARNGAARTNEQGVARLQLEHVAPQCPGQRHGAAQDEHIQRHRTPAQGRDVLHTQAQARKKHDARAAALAPGSCTPAAQRVAPAPCSRGTCPSTMPRPIARVSAPKPKLAAAASALTTDTAGHPPPSMPVPVRPETPAQSQFAWTRL